MSIGTSKFQRSVDITGFFLPFPHYRFVSPLTHRRKLISDKINIFIRFLSPVIHCIGFTHYKVLKLPTPIPTLTSLVEFRIPFVCIKDIAWRVPVSYWVLTFYGLVSFFIHLSISGYSCSRILRFYLFGEPESVPEGCAICVPSNSARQLPILPLSSANNLLCVVFNSAVWQSVRWHLIFFICISLKWLAMLSLFSCVSSPSICLLLGNCLFRSSAHLWVGYLLFWSGIIRDFAFSKINPLSDTPICK